MKMIIFMITFRFLLQRDAVPTQDVRISIVSRRLAAAEDDSVEKQKLERELAQLYSVCFQSKINSISKF